MYKDMTHLMCGSAVHLATQIGLHISGVGQDFARMPVKKDQEQKVLRARLWLCCVIVSIRYDKDRGNEERPTNVSQNKLRRRHSTPRRVVLRL